MSNTYFQFKQFRIEQAQCAMKVSTDACIQGAWTPIEPFVKNVLDIGAGTGLLSLMLAQRHATAAIDAIEIDEQAAGQAAANFRQSPWAERLQLFHGDAKSYPFPKKYELMLCNPPFFKDNLLGADGRRNHARHSLLFSLEDLIKRIEESLTEEGYASVLLPVTEQKRWEELVAAQGHFLSKRLLIHPAIGKPANRIITISRKKAVPVSDEALCIRGKTVQDDHSVFQSLLSPFYLDKE